MAWKGLGNQKRCTDTDADTDTDTDTDTDKLA